MEIPRVWYVQKAVRDNFGVGPNFSTLDVARSRAPLQRLPFYQKPDRRLYNSKS